VVGTPRARVGGLCAQAVAAGGDATSE
jgi:hypothetical protein